MAAEEADDSQLPLLDDGADPLVHVAGEKGMLAHTVETLGETFTTIIFVDLPLILLSVGIFLFFWMLAMLIGIFIRRIAWLLGARVNYTKTTIFIVQATIAVIGAYAALRELGIDFSHIFIGLGIGALAAAQIFIGVFSNIAAGLTIRSSRYLQVGSEVTTSTSFGALRGKVIEHNFGTITVDVTKETNSPNLSLLVVPNTNYQQAYLAHVPNPKYHTDPEPPTRHIGVVLRPKEN